MSRANFNNFKKSPFELYSMPNNKNDDVEDDEREGMDDAFSALDALEGLGDSPEDFPSSYADSLNSDNNDDSSKFMNEELKLYSEMFSELSDKSEDEVYGDILDEMSPSANSNNPEINQQQAEQSVEITETEVSQETLFDQQSQDDFMNRAITEAMEEATRLNNNPDNAIASSDPVVPDNILQDEEMMKEIELIFEKANEKLLASVNDIREEQNELSRKQMEERMSNSVSEEERLREAERSISGLLERVNKEALEVQNAVDDLEKAKAELGDDPLSKAANLKEAGLVKQSALVLGVLLSSRSITDLVLSATGDSSHLVGAGVQGAIAAVCLLFFFLF